MPHMSLFIRPRVDRAAVANEPEKAWFVEFRCRPLVEAPQPRCDQRVVEQPTDTLLTGDVPLDVTRERVLVRDHTAQREKGADHAEARITEDASNRADPPEREARG